MKARLQMKAETTSTCLAVGGRGRGMILYIGLVSIQFIIAILASFAYFILAHPWSPAFCFSQLVFSFKKTINFALLVVVTNWIVNQINYPQQLEHMLIIITLWWQQKNRIPGPRRCQWASMIIDLSMGVPVLGGGDRLFSPTSLGLSPLRYFRIISFLFFGKSVISSLSSLVKRSPRSSSAHLPWFYKASSIFSTNYSIWDDIAKQCGVDLHVEVGRMLKILWLL